MPPSITAPGFYPDLTPADYFAEPCPGPALTNSGIGTLLRTCPARFAYQHPAIGQPAEERGDTAATHMGSLVHRLALGKGGDYAISPFDDYRKQEAQRWKADTEAAGLIPVKQRDHDAACNMADEIIRAIAGELGQDDYQTEVVIAWQHRGRWCRAMIDVWCPSQARAIDVKTIASADDLSIDRAFASGYGRQEAWYLDGIESILGGSARFDFLFVEKETPWLTRTASSTEGMRTGSRADIARAFDIFDACLRTGEWPGYPSRQVQPTSWQVREWAEAELDMAEAA